MQQLHIVSFDIPYPANYGGVIDVFYRIKALSKSGVVIILHCFQYGDRQPQEPLEQWCSQVYYYKRKTGITGISTNLPYTVYSRRNKKLLKRLSQATGPILFDGIHSCYYLDHASLRSKFKVVRCMNVEHEYYQLLAKQATGFKKKYYEIEAARLQKYECVLNAAQHLLSITTQDQDYFKKNYPKVPCTTITAFHGNELEEYSTHQKGNYSLFHGSLNVIENEKAALFLARQVWNGMDFKLVIAGRNPSAYLVDQLDNLENVQLIANPGAAHLEKLIKEAQMHLMYATQSSGLKLKLLKALFKGTHVIANDLMITEPALRSLVSIANNVDQWRAAILETIDLSYSFDNHRERSSQLERFTDEKSAEKLSKILNFKK